MPRRNASETYALFPPFSAFLNIVRLTRGLSRSAFETTVTEERLIASAATIIIRKLHYIPAFLRE